MIVNKYIRKIFILLVAFICSFCLLNKVEGKTCTQGSFWHLSVEYCYEDIKSSEGDCGTACARPDIGKGNRLGDFIVQLGSKVNDEVRLYRQNSKTRIFCVYKGETSPAYNGSTGYACNTNTYNFAQNNTFLKAAIGYVIRNSTDDPENYAKSQKVIHKLLNKYNEGEAVSYYDGDLYDAAVAHGTNYNNNVPGTYYLAKTYTCANGIQPIADGYTTVTVDNRVNIAYHPNGGTTSLPKNEYGWVKYNNEVYFHKIKHGESSDPYNISTLGITRSGYGFSGWQVSSTGQILNQDTVYYSTTYADHSDRNKTSANTKEVYCYLYAQ